MATRASRPFIWTISRRVSRGHGLHRGSQWSLPTRVVRSVRTVPRTKAHAAVTTNARRMETAPERRTRAAFVAAVPKAKWAKSIGAWAGNVRRTPTAAPSGYCRRSNRGRYCHTLQDECVEETNCGEGRVCERDAERGRWSCHQCAPHRGPSRSLVRGQLRKGYRQMMSSREVTSSRTIPSSPRAGNRAGQLRQYATLQTRHGTLLSTIVVAYLNARAVHWVSKSRSECTPRRSLRDLLETPGVPRGLRVTTSRRSRAAPACAWARANCPSSKSNHRVAKPRARKHPAATGHDNRGFRARGRLRRGGIRTNLRTRHNRP